MDILLGQEALGGQSSGMSSGCGLKFLVCNIIKMTHRLKSAFASSSFDLKLLRHGLPFCVCKVSTRVDLPQLELLRDMKMWARKPLMVAIVLHPLGGWNIGPRLEKLHMESAASPLIKASAKLWQ